MSYKNKIDSEFIVLNKLLNLSENIFFVIQHLVENAQMPINKKLQLQSTGQPSSQ